MSGTAGTTSGTVLGYSFPQRKVIDHAFRRAGWVPQQITSEWIEVAQDLLFLQLSEYVNFGFPLWTRQELPLALAIGSPNVTLPVGTVDLFHAYWRSFMPWRSGANDTAGVDISALFGGVANADVTIAGPNPGAGVNFVTSTEVDSIGVLPGTAASYTASLLVQTSPDGVTYTTVQTLPSTTFATGVWSYFDLAPSVSAIYTRLVLSGVGSWVLNQLNFCLANSTQIDIGLQNIDDYYDLPNKFFQGSQVNTAYLDRQRDSPVLKIWPTPNSAAFYNGTMVALSRRYIQDPGSMTQTLEIPARWFEGVIARLAIRLIDAMPDSTDPQQGQMAMMMKQQRRTNLDASAQKAEAGMWSEERNRSPIRIMPNLRPYTA